MTETQEQIIEKLLANPEEVFTIRSLARKMNKSYPLVFNNLKKLKKMEVIEEQSIPPAKRITVKDAAPKNILLYIEEKRREEFLKKHLWVRVMLQDLITGVSQIFFSLIVFGSYAKGNQTSNSDLDLLVIVPKKEDIHELESAIRNVYTRIKKNFIVTTVNDFKEMVKNSEEFNVGNEAKKYHILLYGTEQFYQLI